MKFSTVYSLGNNNYNDITPTILNAFNKTNVGLIDANIKLANPNPVCYIGSVIFPNPFDPSVDITILLEFVNSQSFESYINFKLNHGEIYKAIYDNEINRRYEHFLKNSSKKVIFPSKAILKILPDIAVLPTNLTIKNVNIDDLLRIVVELLDSNPRISIPLIEPGKLTDKEQLSRFYNKIKDLTFNEKAKFNICYDISNILSKNNYTMPTFSIEESQLKIECHKNSSIEFKFNYMYNFTLTASNTHVVGLYNDIPLRAPISITDLIFKLQIMFNDYRKPYDLYYFINLILAKRTGQIYYVTIKERVLKSFNIRLVDPADQLLNASGVCSLHFDT